MQQSRRLHQDAVPLSIRQGATHVFILQEQLNRFAMLLEYQSLLFGQRLIRR